MDLEGGDIWRWRLAGIILLQIYHSIGESRIEWGNGFIYGVRMRSSICSGDALLNKSAYLRHGDWSRLTPTGRAGSCMPTHLLP